MQTDQNVLQILEITKDYQYKHSSCAGHVTKKLEVCDICLLTLINMTFI